MNVKLEVNPMDFAEDSAPSSCIFCAKTEDESELIDIESNSLLAGGSTILLEFSDLIFDVLNLTMESGYLCIDCQTTLSQFYFFKRSALSNMENFESERRTTIIKKLDMFLEDCESTDDLVVLRYNQCFAVVPESKRALMENFQSWQPRVNFVRVNHDKKPAMKLENVKNDVIVEQRTEEEENDANFYDEIIVEDDQEYCMDAEEAEQDIEEASIELETTSNNNKPSKKHREWANETTKLCYSIEKSEEGTVPIWTCCHCEKIYYSAQALRLHLLAKHIVEDNAGASLTDEIKEWLRIETKQRRILIETQDGSKFEWTCGICKYTCISSNSFRSHLIETHVRNSKPPAVINSEQTLNYHQQQWIQSHIKQESGDNSWKCLKCEITFRTEKLLRQHLVDHALSLTTDDFRTIKSETIRPRKSKAMKFKWTCQECWFQFSAQRSFDAHMRLHKTIEGMTVFTHLHNCVDCKMFFRSHSDLMLHLDGHNDNQSLLVPADGIALQKTILFKRLPVPLEAQKGEFSCGHCGRQLNDEMNCKSHLLIHHVNPLVCPKDDRPFSAMQPFICHLQKVHPEILPESLRCTHCKLPFTNIYERLAHMKQCDEKKFHCDHCDRRFSNKNFLNSHLKREMGLMSCACPVCGKVVKAKDELKIHMRSHTKEKPFKCSVCDKTYTTTSARASHMETHKDTSIQCELCLVKFVARRHYMVHYKRFHDEVYRQQKLNEQTCHLCAKQFIRRDRLREHVLKAHASEME